MRDPPPALDAFFHGFGQMGVRPLRDHRRDAAYPKLRDLFYRPLEPIEFEHRDYQPDIDVRLRRYDDIPQRERHSLGIDSRDRAQSQLTAVRQLECLPNLRAQHLRQMPRILSGDRRAITLPFIRDPSPPTHSKILQTSRGVTLLRLLPNALVVTVPCPLGPFPWGYPNIPLTLSMIPLLRGLFSMVVSPSSCSNNSRCCFVSLVGT